jgi:hypothetical protein
MRHPFPHLRADNSAQTSIETRNYNCIAWAAGEDHRWWAPNDPNWQWWPWSPTGPDDLKKKALIKAYRAVGFEVCKNGDLDACYDKIALYGIGTEWKHAARLCYDGKWTSKLGENVDISHDTVDAVSGPEYGTCYCYMRRPKWRFLQLRWKSNAPFSYRPPHL